MINKKTRPYELITRPGLNDKYTMQIYEIVLRLRNSQVKKLEGSYLKIAAGPSERYQINHKSIDISWFYKKLSAPAKDVLLYIISTQQRARNDYDIDASIANVITMRISSNDVGIDKNRLHKHIRELESFDVIRRLSPRGQTYVVNPFIINTLSLRQSRYLRDVLCRLSTESIDVDFDVV